MVQEDIFKKGLSYVCLFLCFLDTLSLSRATKPNVNFLSHQNLHFFFVELLYLSQLCSYLRQRYTLRSVYDLSYRFFFIF